MKSHKQERARIIEAVSEEFPEAVVPVSEIYKDIQAEWVSIDLPVSTGKLRIQVAYENSDPAWWIQLAWENHQRTQARKATENREICSLSKWGY